ncbi:beta-lactamase family protein [Streptomyces sp. NBC_00378]|uniref:serine hydrolase domain-containing protein n=1 Tax=Streptomyces sp. NBC_00378 TaxID=2975732 RepID=UPI00225AD432|nr:serine hydrolase domain-containing protein [Streptomyces sp. NBC_00378]MCX5109723.1 beta-lactamase family protein [Streptomyces sp. NBC_00378]
MRQRTARISSLALAVAAIAGTAAFGPSAQAAPAPIAAAHETQSPRGHEATRAALRAVVEQGELPGVAAMARDSRGSWYGSAGHADTATGRERSPGDHFRGASITKTFVATVLLQLEAEQKLSLDDSVEHWLPGLVRGNGYDGSRITLRSLLNHTSGIADHTSDPAFVHDAAGPGFPEHRYDTHTPEELVAVALKYPPVPDPQKAPLYSNTNYVIAGMVIEKATGRSYAQEATRRIIRPLKLRGTSFPGTEPQMPDPHPVAYSRFHQETPDAEIHDATTQNMTWLGASGDIISTAGDLNRFQRSLMEGELLPPAQMKEMLDEVPLGNGTGYGLGVEFAELSCGVKVVGKSGRTNGSLSAMVGTMDGKHQLTFNINGDWLWDGDTYVNVIEAEFCDKTPAPAPAPAPAATDAPDAVNVPAAIN